MRLGKPSRPHRTLSGSPIPSHAGLRVAVTAASVCNRLSQYICSARRMGRMSAGAWERRQRANQPLTPSARTGYFPSRLRGDLAGRLAATLKKSLKGRAREPTRQRPARAKAGQSSAGFLLPAVGPGEERAHDQRSRQAEKSRKPGASRRGSCTGAACAPSSPRPPRRSSSPRATSTPAPSRPRSASRARAGFIYSRYANPDGRACSRSACGCWKVPAPPAPPRPAWRRSPRRCCASSRPAITWWRRRALFGSCRYVVEELCPRFGIASHAGRRPRHQGLGARHAPQHQGVLLRDAGQPDARPRRHRRRVRDRPRGRRAGGGRQRVRHAGAAEAPEARRRRRGLLRHQARRRPGPLPRRRRAGLGGLRQGPPAQLPQAHRALAQPVQCLGDAEGPGDAAPARARAMRGRAAGSPTIWRARRASRGCCSAAAPTTRRRRSPSGR